MCPQGAPPSSSPGASFLSSFRGELEDVVHAIEAVAVSVGGGKITSMVFQKAVSNLVSSARVAFETLPQRPELRCRLCCPPPFRWHAGRAQAKTASSMGSSGPRLPSAQRTPSKLTAARMASTPGGKALAASDAAFAHPSTPTTGPVAGATPGTGGTTATNPASGGSSGSGSKTRSRMAAALKAPMAPLPGTTGTGTRGDPLVFDKPAAGVGSTTDASKAEKFAGRDSAGDVVVQFAATSAAPVSKAPFLQATQDDEDGDITLPSTAGVFVPPGVTVTAGMPSWMLAATQVAAQTTGNGAGAAGIGVGAPSLPRSERYMHTTIQGLEDALEARILSMEEALVAAHSLPDPVPVGVTAQHQVVVVGRIVTESEAGTGRINAKSILLEGSRATSNGHRVRLDVSRLGQYALFPGQIVAVQGMATSDSVLVATGIISDAALPLAHTPVHMLKEDATRAAAAAPGAVTGVGARGRGGGPLRIWSACGPFTLNSDLNFAPLTDLLAEVRGADCPPDALVLMGPFIPADHPAVAAGHCTVDNGAGATFTLSLRDLWELKIAPILNSALQEGPAAATRLVLVSSPNDVLCHPVVPTPAYSSAPGDFQGAASAVQDASFDLAPFHEALQARTTCVPSPSVFTIGEGGEAVTVGAMSTDVLFHLNRADLSRLAAPTADKAARFKRLAGHILGQRCWYPLFPPPEDTPVDPAWSEWLDLPCTPDVLLLPSRLPPFVAKHQETKSLLVSHGHLSMFSVGGTYATVDVHPRTGIMTNPEVRGAAGAKGSSAAEVEAASHHVADRAVVKVLKV